MAIDEKIIRAKGDLDKVYGHAHEVGYGEGYNVGYEKGSSRYDEGYNDGYTHGENTGYKVGLDEGIEQGEQAEWGRFWDAFQYEGNRVAYPYAFTNIGNVGNSGIPGITHMFPPKHSLMVCNCDNMFSRWGSKTTFTINSEGKLVESYFNPPNFIAIDLIDYLKNNGVSIEFNNPCVCNGTFSYSLFTRVPALISSSLMSMTYAGMKSLETIEGDLGSVFVNTSGNSFSSTFASCTALKNVTFAPIIGNGLDLKSSTLLTHESLMSLINALTDKTTDTSRVWKVTLGTDNLNKLTDEEKAIATAKGWTLA